MYAIRAVLSPLSSLLVAVNGNSTPAATLYSVEIEYVIAVGGCIPLQRGKLNNVSSYSIVAEIAEESV